MKLYDRHKGLCRVSNLKHLVLTVPTVAHIDRAYVSWLRGCFRKLRRRQVFSRAWRGGVYTIETTYKADRGWHVHIHALIDGEYVPQSVIKAHWHDITGNAYIVSIQVARRAREVLKYVLKPSQELLARPWALREFLVAMHGSHLVSGWGRWYGVTADDDHGPWCCVFCGGLEFSRLVVPGSVNVSGIPLVRWDYGTCRWMLHG
ncbi:unnamed protein product [marine sediment metagenome]|uniref:Replication protein n=1 Tax=marine sediment metagenome TaxID=412755 RepID=X1SIE1_9ZZZZ